jgi:hypothetical protein
VLFGAAFVADINAYQAWQSKNECESVRAEQPVSLILHILISTNLHMLQVQKKS